MTAATQPAEGYAISRDLALTVQIALAPAWGDLLTAARDVDEHTECRSDSCGWYVVVPAEYLDVLHRCVQQATEATR